MYYSVLYSIIYHIFPHSAISPMSGPTAGGTVLTVNGSNLGAVAADVRVDLMNAEENISCIVDGSKYIPGMKNLLANWLWFVKQFVDLE